jgi:hypothetical protein
MGLLAAQQQHLQHLRVDDAYIVVEVVHAGKHVEAVGIVVAVSACSSQLARQAPMSARGNAVGSCPQCAWCAGQRNGPAKWKTATMVKTAGWAHCKKQQWEAAPLPSRKRPASPITEGVRWHARAWGSHALSSMEASSGCDTKAPPLKACQAATTCQ